MPNNGCSRIRSGEIADARDVEALSQQPDDLRKRATKAAHLGWATLQARDKATAAGRAFDEAWADLDAAGRDIAKARLQEMVRLGGPPSLQLSLCELERHEADFAAGDRYALAKAIAECARGGLRMPKWVAEAVNRGFSEVDGIRVDSWEEVLGWPHPKGVHRDRLRERLNIRGHICLYVKALTWGFGRPIQKDLFDEVGAMFGIGATLCEELYREADRRIKGARQPSGESRKSGRSRGKTRET